MKAPVGQDQSGFSEWFDGLTPLARERYISQRKDELIALLDRSKWLSANAGFWIGLTAGLILAVLTR